MKNLQEATENICRLKGNALALETLLMAVCETLSADQRRQVARSMAQQAEAGQSVLLASAVSEHLVAAYEADVRRLSARVQA